MSDPSAPLLLRLDRFDPESGLFASFADSPRVPLLRLRPLPTSGRKILEAIGALDENAARLLPRFRRKFPDMWAAVEAVGAGLPNGTDQSLFFFFSLCSVALGIEEADIRDAASVFSGLQIDYALIQEEEQWLLDTRTTLRSLWSYKLAEVSNALLLFSLFESLGQTLGAFAGRCGDLLRAQAIRLSGDLAAHPFLRAGLRRGLPRGFATLEEAPASDASLPNGLNASGRKSADPDLLPAPAARATEEREPTRVEG